jgi:hypothetical protein
MIGKEKEVLLIVEDISISDLEFIQLFFGTKRTSSKLKPV